MYEATKLREKRWFAECNSHNECALQQRSVRARSKAEAIDGWNRPCPLIAAAHARGVREERERIMQLLEDPATAKALARVALASLQKWRG